MSPHSIADPLIGHRPRWAALARAFAAGTVPQTLLISGSPQVGKSTLARRYCQLLLCPKIAPDKDGLPAPCGHCHACHQIEIETFPDLHVFRPLVSSVKDEKDWVVAPEELEGSIISVEVARKFGRESWSKPMVGARQVMIMHQADRMSDEAQNALLKTFEEPISSLTIVLLTDNPSSLLPTVRSRCWHLPLGLATDAAIRQWLAGQFEAAPELVEEAVRVGAGRPGAAWREATRICAAPAAPGRAGEEATRSAGISRFAIASALVERIEASQPVGALGLTEEALRLARDWWAQDQVHNAALKDVKKADSKVLRSAAARFLDELSRVYRSRWLACGAGIAAGETDLWRESRAALKWADGLDQIRKTRHYILRNANTNLALDVLFGRLIN